MLSGRFRDDLRQEERDRDQKENVVDRRHLGGAGLEALTSPSLVSTVRTRMLLFMWASGVLVSRLMSEG